MGMINEICTFAPKSKIKAGEATKDGQYIFFTSSEDESKKYNEYIYDGEGIIMGTGGNATLHYYNGKYATSTDCLVLLPDKEIIDCKYLYYFFLSNMSLLEAGFKGAGLKHTNKKYIGNIEINHLPTKDQQLRVVSILDTVTSLIVQQQKEINLLDELIKSRFVEMFGDLNSTFHTVTIESVCKDTRTGPFGSALHHDEFVDDGVFVLGIDNAVENKFSYNRMRYITVEKYQQLKRYTVYPGDVIITIMGTIGRSAVIPDNIPLAINTKHLACLTPNNSVVNSTFLCCAFQMHPRVLSQITNNAKGAIMDGLNLGLIKSVKFQLPPLELQKQFEIIYLQVEMQKATVQQSIDKLETLKKSLMQEYFG